MAISIVAASNLADGQINGADPTITWPTLAENDVTYVACSVRFAPSMNTSGYTQVGTVTHGSGTMTLRVFRKVQGVTPDTTAQFEGGGSANDGAVIVGVALRGVDTTTPEDATSTTNSGASTNPDPASITTVTDGAWVLAFAGMRLVDASVTVPSGYTNHATTTANDTNPQTAAVATILKSTAGAENPPNWTNWSTGDWCAVTVAVRPAAAGGSQSSLLCCFP